MWRAWVPLGCALLQGIMVITPGGTPDRSAWALSLAPICGVANGRALWFRDRAPLMTTDAVAAGYSAQALVPSRLLPRVARQISPHGTRRLVAEFRPSTRLRPAQRGALDARVPARPRSRSNDGR